MKNFNVLIDGYNLRLKNGSGIKYYTLSLAKILKNEVNLSFLFDFSLDEELLLINFIEKIKRGEFPTSLKKALMSFVHVLKSFKVDDNVFKEKEFEIYNSSMIYNKEALFRLVEGLSKYNQYITLNINNIDIFHSTYFLNLKIKKAKRITTIHDLIPFKLPETTLDNKKEFYNKVKFALKHSDKIITISEQSKKDILEYFDVNDNKIVNCYQSIYMSDINNIKLSVKNRFGLQEKGYFLFVGNIEPKKNIKRLINAFFSFDNPFPLVIVGRKAWLWEELLKGTEYLIKSKKLIILEYLNREELIALYKNAFAFIFPSLYEGFGLPPLEAMATETPVITSNISSLPEVCGDAAIYCDPYSVSSIREAIIKMIDLSEEERADLIKKGRKRVEFFNEEDYKNRILKVYESVL